MTPDAPSQDGVALRTLMPGVRPYFADVLHGMRVFQAWTMGVGAGDMLLLAILHPQGAFLTYLEIVLNITIVSVVGNGCFCHGMTSTLDRLERVIAHRLRAEEETQS